MGNKYLFRVYNTDKQGNLLSPFSDNASAHRYNKKYTTDEVYQSSNSFDVPNGSIYHRGKVYPKSDTHIGFSAFGKVDPKYAIFDVNEDTWDEGIAKALAAEIRKNIPESFKSRYDLKNAYADGETNDYEYLTNRIYEPEEILRGINKLNNGKGNLLKFTLSPDTFDFDSDNVWDDFVEGIDMYDIYHTKTPFDIAQGNSKVILAAAPEEALLTIDDVINNGYTQQRDFPHEIVTRTITPIRELNEYPVAKEKYYKLRDKGATGKEAFNDSFKLNPEEIPSDESIKNIYKDMCHFVRSSRRSNNILNGIKEYGQ